MKLLIISDVFFPDTIGGAGRVAYHLSLEISKKGHTVHVITRNPGNQYDIYQKLDDNFHIYRFSTSMHESIKLLSSEIRNSYLISKNLISKNKYDYICIHQCLAGIGPSFTGIYKQIPLIYVYHSPWHQEYLIKKQSNMGKCSKNTKIISYLMRWTEKWVLSKASRGFVLSEYMLKNIQRNHPKNNTPISILPGGVDLDHFHLLSEDKDYLKNEIKFPLNKRVFLTVRNLVPRMGIENLINAFNHSPELRNNSMLFIGGCGPLENSLKSMVASCHLEETVKMIGRIPDDRLPCLYQTADFFVLPTVELEGFGLVILEAMACGTPVLGTPVGAIPEILSRFDERLIFRGTGWKDIKEKLEQVVESPEQWKFDPIKCREFVEKDYSWKKLADKFEKKMLELVK
jgi:glycosyltransferase involved in cell wall biosynthesis